MIAVAIWDSIREGLGSVLAFFYSIIPNSGVAIILLTVAVRLVLFPLTAKQAKSMIAMQRVQPEIKKLQAKYKNDRQKLNEEMMKFYKENQINPLGGCLPLLLQMPVFIALFQTLRDIQQVHPDRLADVRTTSAASPTPSKCTPDMHFAGMNLTTSASKAASSGFGVVLALPRPRRHRRRHRLHPAAPDDAEPDPGQPADGRSSARSSRSSSPSSRGACPRVWASTSPPRTSGRSASRRSCTARSGARPSPPPKKGQGEIEGSGGKGKGGGGAAHRGRRRPRRAPANQGRREGRIGQGRRRREVDRARRREDPRARREPPADAKGGDQRREGRRRNGSKNGSGQSRPAGGARSNRKRKR